MGRGLVHVPYSIAVDPVTPSTVYVGVRGLGIYRSIDGAASWSEFNPGMPAQSAYDFVVGPAYVGRTVPLEHALTAMGSMFRPCRAR